MNDILYVIPCKIITLNHLDYLKKCVKSISDLMENDDKILIVDSDSKIKDHFNISSEKIIVADIKNKNYEAGALLYAYKNFDFKRFLLIHDSCELKENIKKLDGNIYVYNYVYDWFGCEDIHVESTIKYLYKTKWFKIPEEFITIVGSIFFAKKTILDIIYKNGIENLLPQNKIDSCAFERIFGIILTKEGYKDEIVNNNKLPIFKNFLGRT